MKGTYFRQGKKWIIKYKDPKSKEDVLHEVDGQAKSRMLEAPLTGVMEVEFTLNAKKVPEYKTVVEVKAAASAPAGPQGLPSKYAALNRDFFALPPERQQWVLASINRDDRQDLTEKEVALVLTAAKQNFPLVFQNEEKFRSALGKLILRSRADVPKLLNSYECLSEQHPPSCIMIHGSSVGGLRGKKKPGKGWTFDASSDVDITIVDMTRFCWAQALGIMTYSDLNTIELSDQHLHLLKLYNFAKQLRDVVKGRNINFCIYKNVAAAKTHSGFTLMCEYLDPVKGFTITKIYTKEYVEQIPPDKRALTLEQFFNVGDLPDVDREQIATNEIVAASKSKTTLPDVQGNHLFNDVPATLVGLVAKLKEKLDTDRSGPIHLGIEFTAKYFAILATAANKLRKLSRDLTTAQKEHGATNCAAIMNGFKVESDKVNELLYGNAVTYFANCSLVLCRIALRDFGSPTTVQFLIPPLKKAFSNLLDAAVDERLLAGLKTSNALQKYALQMAAEYQDNIRHEVNNYFKTSMDQLMALLKFDLLFSKLDLSKLSGPQLQCIFDEDPEHQWYLQNAGRLK